MAGYVTKLQGHVYDGAHAAGEALTNGVFVELTGGQAKKTAAAKDMMLRVAEKTTLWGLPALVLDVVSVGLDEVFFTENEWSNNEGEDWDEARNTLAAGKQVRMKRLLPGEQVILSVEEALFTATVVGSLMQPAAAGTVAAPAEPAPEG